MYYSPIYDATGVCVCTEAPGACMLCQLPRYAKPGLPHFMSCIRISTYMCSDIDLSARIVEL